MGLFNRDSSPKMLAQMRDDEAKAAENSRKRAAQVEATGQPVYGIDAEGWRRRAETFQEAADGYQQQIDRRSR